MQDIPIISAVVAMSENRAIGLDNQMPWHLPDDLRWFRRQTLGKPVIMGRKTYESIGRLLPGRTTVIVTRQSDYKVEGAKIVHGIQEALAACVQDKHPFVIGGSEIYRLALRFVQEIQLTRVHAEIQGDTFLPKIDWDQWEAVSRQRHEGDDKTQLSYSFEVYRRKPTGSAH